MNPTHFFRPLVAFCAAILLQGCIYDSSSLIPEPGSTKTGIDDDVAYLSLSISTADMPAMSRADDYSFEDAANDYEKINTMRFLIADSRGYVEHNVYVTQSAALKTAQHLFKVEAYDTKTIYLIGNEASLPSEVITPITSLIKGQMVPSSLKDLTLSRSESDPLYSNSQVIPMTEIFTLSVGGPIYEDDGITPVPYEYTLFVTRTAVKVNFNLTIEDDNTNFSPSFLSDVTLCNLADKEYLFPTSTTYSPEKSTIASERIVTSYAVPSDTVSYPYSFDWAYTPPSSSQTAANATVTNFYTQSVYLPETIFGEDADNQSYYITLPVNGYTLTAPLPNLPTLPRNTHVEINITLSGNELNCVVRLVPYIGVVLEPEFGFDALYPGSSTDDD